MRGCRQTAAILLIALCALRREAGRLDIINIESDVILFTTRRSRLLLVTSRRWQRRALVIVGGLLIGVIAVGLALAADESQTLFKNIAIQWPLLPLVVTPLGFTLAAMCVIKVFPNTQGSGIPQAIAARAMKTTGDRLALVGLRVAIGKVILTLFGLLVGASTGREGPTVQVGASLMFLMGRLTPRRQRGLILAGSAAGVAAAFNTPLAGIVFAVEEMSRSFEARTNGLIIGAVILAGLTAQSLQGDYTYFGFTSEYLPIQTACFAIPLCGLAGGLSGAVFSRLLTSFPDVLPSHAATFVKSRPLLVAAACGLGVALCGLASGGTVYGTGYEQASAAVHNTASLSYYYGPLKFIATALSAISGIPGGLFSPSLSIGASIGYYVSQLFQSSVTGPIVLLGMVAYFTGVVRAPITGFVIVSEMSGGHKLLVALMATALIADFVSRLINPQGVYHTLSKRFLRP